MNQKGERNKCRVCGCTDHNKCAFNLTETCWWIDVDLCSVCRGSKESTVERVDGTN